MQKTSWKKVKENAGSIFRLAGIKKMPTILPAFSRACNKNVNHLAHPMYWPDHSQPALNANVMSSSVCDCSDAKVFVFSSSLWRLSQSGGSRQAFSERSLAITRADQVLLISRSIQTSNIKKGVEGTSCPSVSNAIYWNFFTTLGKGLGDLPGFGKRPYFFRFFLYPSLIPNTCCECELSNCADKAYFQGDMRENLKISSSAACVWILSKESGLSVSTLKMRMVF